MKFCGLLLLTFGGFRRFLFCLFMEFIYIWWMNGIFIKIYLQMNAPFFI